MERKLFMDKIACNLLFILLLFMTGCGMELIDKADSSFHKGDYSTSSILYEKYLVNHPDAFVDMRKYGLSLLKGGNPEKAAVQFNRVIEDRPYDSLSLLYLGIAYLRLGDHQKALAVWQDYIARGRYSQRKTANC